MPSQQSRSSILLMVDGLRASSIGPYGNTWYETACCNQLASKSLLFEQCISDSPVNQLGIQGIFSGQHCCVPTTTSSQLIDVVGTTEVESVLITWNTQNIPECQDCFDTVIEVDLPTNEQLAEEISSTALASYFAAAVDFVQNHSEPCFLVLDSPGLAASWDAPYSFREQLADTDDPEPSTKSTPPNRQVNGLVDDPDVLLDFQMAYGGQVSMFDQLLGIFLDEVDQSKWASQALFCLTAGKGFPLGEHGVVGHYRPILYTENVHVPLIVRWPSQHRVIGRSQQLVQPGSLYSLLSDWHLVERTEDQPRRTTYPIIDKTQLLPQARDSVLLTKCELEGAMRYALQTRSWRYIKGSSVQLFVKPDDAWDFNDVSQLCPEIASEMQRELEMVLEKLSQGSRPSLMLSDALAFGIE